ncbi:tyrosine-type recombinase/integrase [Ochrobactrum sp. Q0168]|uniref:tyrosine-type recombinase/integrase n=1 Tax=Ochrobactrum sp. Q0168 TaxID=2793241 RepID=UPI0018EC0F17|nr:tyrosine-type recombinase/integrase [Ochrobactrum sp. Q0168]
MTDAPGKDDVVPTHKQVLTIVLAMPHENFIQRRDQALLAFLLLSGTRISAALSLQLRHINLENRSVFQNARIVKTKNAKTMHTAWFPVGEEFEAIFTNWVTARRHIQ